MKILGYNEHTWQNESSFNTKKKKEEVLGPGARNYNDLEKKQHYF